MTNVDHIRKCYILGVENLDGYSIGVLIEFVVILPDIILFKI